MGRKGGTEGGGREGGRERCACVCVVVDFLARHHHRLPTPVVLSGWRSDGEGGKKKSVGSGVDILVPSRVEVGDKGIIIIRS